MKVLAFAAVKGGVGKTTAAVNVAASSVVRGKATLLWDLDPQASSCHLLGVRPADAPPIRRKMFGRVEMATPSRSDVTGLSVLPAYAAVDSDSSLRSIKELNKVIELASSHFDLLVLDLPAGVDSAAVAAVEAGASIAVPVVPSVLSVRTFDQFNRYAGNRLRGFVNMVDPTLKRHEDFVEELRDGNRNILDTWIPSTVEIERAGEQGKTVGELFPNGRAAKAFKQLWLELSDLS